jgi:protein-tyrosine phosphatase
MLNDTLPHVVPLKGGSNFRDLGGYRTADGRTVRRRAVFRSAHLGTLTDEDRAALSKLGVRTIVDCRVVGAHIEPQLGDRIRSAVADGTATPHFMMDLFTDHYREYPRRCAPGFRTLFATLSDGTHRPLVFHCTAGKDRTGFASALLLTLLGVSWETVMEDYLRTNELWTGHIGRHPELDIDTRAAIIEARTPYLEAAFEVVRADFGSPEAFAEKALGLDAAARERLRVDLLEG